MVAMQNEGLALARLKALSTMTYHEEGARWLNALTLLHRQGRREQGASRLTRMPAACS